MTAMTERPLKPAIWNGLRLRCPNCGKGNPMQVAEMSHGAAPARFRRVTFVDVAN